MKDKETILQLYNNYIDEIYTMTVEKLDVSKEIVTLENELDKTMTEQQKEILKKLQQKEDEKNEIVYKQVFVFAYSLANKLMIESLTDNKNKTTED